MKGKQIIITGKKTFNHKGKKRRDNICHDRIGRSENKETCFSGLTLILLKNKDIPLINNRSKESYICWDPSLIGEVLENSRAF